MAIFDDLDLQGGFHGDASLDFNLEDNFSGSPNIATISPNDVWNDDAMFSNPPSTAFPPLETPASEWLDSPDFSSGLNTTPMLEGALDSELDMTKIESMPSLFPDENFDSYEPVIAPNNSFGSLTELHATTSTAPTASPMVRQKSSPGRPPIVHDRKASLSAGIAKANQKPRKDLPEISIESDDDKETAKRKKNTAAARKSRARKQETMSAMSSEITRLRKIIEALGADPDVDFGL